MKFELELELVTDEQGNLQAQVPTTNRFLLYGVLARAEAIIGDWPQDAGPEIAVGTWKIKHADGITSVESANPSKTAALGAIGLFRESLTVNMSLAAINAIGQQAREQAMVNQIMHGKTNRYNPNAPNYNHVHKAV